MPVDSRSSSINWQDAEYDKNPILEELLNGRRVVFVGPSPHLKGLGLGSEIDSYDVVVRAGQIINVPDNLKQDYGSRTDILVGSFNHFEIADYKKKIDEFKNLKFVLCSMLSASFLEGHEIFFNELKSIVPVQNVDDKYLYRRFEEVGTVCNCGFSGILILLNYDIKELFVTGVNFYNMGKFGNIYYDEYYDAATGAGILSGNRLKSISAEQARSDIHDQPSQIRYFRKLVKEKDEIIKLDNYLNENLFKE